MDGSFVIDPFQVPLPRKRTRRIKYRTLITAADKLPKVSPDAGIDQGWQLADASEDEDIHTVPRGLLASRMKIPVEPQVKGRRKKKAEEGADVKVVELPEGFSTDITNHLIAPISAQVRFMRIHAQRTAFQFEEERAIVEKMIRDLEVAVEVAKSVGDVVDELMGGYVVVPEEHDEGKGMVGLNLARQ